MPNGDELLAWTQAAVVAPAGHGKTELIANVAALGRRALVLTHTHAGVHALRSRLKRLGVPASRAVVDTIAGWSMRYAHAFPGVARPPNDLPQTGAEWDQLYRGAQRAVAVPAVRAVVGASYDRILIDEYQDCGELQHELAVALSAIVPTLVFGDPMQGIFEFAGARLSWATQIHPRFPLAQTLHVPHRWRLKNPALGEWIAETREKLIRGEDIDLGDPRINYRQSSDAFDMGTLFDGLDGREGSLAAIHCNKGLCYRLARAANGGYQAIEEVAAKRLLEFGAAWDQAGGADERRRALLALLSDCFQRRAPAEGEPIDPECLRVDHELQQASARLAQGNGVVAALELMHLCRQHPRWRLFRNELWRDAERALTEVAEARAETLAVSTARIRQRISNSGRRLPKRTISTPLLLKGLEFDHVVIPDAPHFAQERHAQAKLFYVAISRATQSLTIAAPTRWLRLPPPSL